MKKMLMMCVVLAVFGATSSFAKCPHLPKLEVVQNLEIERYLGKWYEIATIPQSFQKGCVGVTANYSLRPDGDIDVLNTCFKNTLDGKYKEAHGKAWIVHRDEPAKLKVQFFWPFSGKYWIIELGQNYEYSVVGHPSRKYFWILSRTPQLDPKVLEGILKRAQEKGYDLAKIKMTLQPQAAQ